MLCKHQWAAAWQAAGSLWSQMTCVRPSQWQPWTNAHPGKPEPWRWRRPGCKWLAKTVTDEVERSHLDRHWKRLKSARKKKKKRRQEVRVTLKVFCMVMDEQGNNDRVVKCYLSGDVLFCQLYIIFHSAALCSSHFNQSGRLVSFQSLLHQVFLSWYGQINQSYLI